MDQNIPLFQAEDASRAPLPKLLRLQFRARYCLAIMLNDSDVSPLVYWSMDQALMASGLARGLWDSVDTEVLTLVIDPEVPAGYRLFGVQSRRGITSNVVVWGPKGMLSRSYSSFGSAHRAIIDDLSQIERSISLRKHHETA